MRQADLNRTLQCQGHHSQDDNTSPVKDINRLAPPPLKIHNQKRSYKGMTIKICGRREKSEQVGGRRVLS